jgi:hypothetical protein
MVQGPWKEAKYRTVKLPEADEEAFKLYADFVSEQDINQRLLQLDVWRKKAQGLPQIRTSLTRLRSRLLPPR